MKTPEVLRWAGGLGHTWVVTVVRPDKGYEEIYAQCSSGNRAYQAFTENEYSKAIYQRSKRGWKKVDPRLALIS